MAEEDTQPDSPRGSTGCCGCLRPAKRGANVRNEYARSLEAAERGGSLQSPTFLVPPSSPVSENGSASHSSLPTPSNRSTSPLDDEDLTLGFFTKEHKASFVDDDGVISALYQSTVSPPPSLAADAPSGTLDLFSSQAGSLASQDDNLAALLPPPALVQGPEEEEEGKEEKQGIPTIATPEQYRIQEAKEKEVEEGDAAEAKKKLKAQTPSLTIPALMSPGEVQALKMRQRKVEEAEAVKETEEAKRKERKIPKLNPPGTLFSPFTDAAAQDSEAADVSGQSPRYVALVSRVTQLSLDLETAKTRAKKSRLLLEWCELRANTMEENARGLSQELTQLQAVYLDLQARHLAQLGITLPEE